MTSTAVLLVLVVIAVMVAIIIFDVFTLGTKGRLNALRQWQALIGTMLGFVTGAGVLAISSAIQDETQVRRDREALVQVGHALRVEARDLDSVLARAQLLRETLMPSDPNKPAGCSGTVNELVDAFQRETPIYTAAVPNFIEVGEPNLALFVSFYAGFEELARAAKQYADNGCPVVAKETVTLFYSRVDAVRADFATIAEIYK
ncbi:hypothetical protein VW23_000045 [Devosia insulae DS-56]|uniref:Uncharacterized protein n=1 Tax=Devosia insulae DS-56 TaxID=1116389 RepID=A0A1E5XXN6_9HYPH|nr:hypothetical protein [Devosia insulae]OEO33323.1 hypothetical protein VW23_000045 [Devosia insulae DS-56]